MTDTERTGEEAIDYVAAYDAAAAADRDATIEAALAILKSHPEEVEALLRACVTLRFAEYVRLSKQYALKERTANSTLSMHLDLHAAIDAEAIPYGAICRVGDRYMLSALGFDRGSKGGVVKTFWVRWLSPERDSVPLGSGFRGCWCTGYGCGHYIFCAVIDAKSEAAAKRLVHEHSTVFEFSFCDERPLGYAPPADRFPPCKPQESST
jgi:hypothetical protein